jgi:superfamily II DNA helicase RecQ
VALCGPTGVISPFIALQHAQIKTVEVIAATSAFGMGIDRANMRFVFHYDISPIFNADYQKIGRAGRNN